MLRPIRGAFVNAPWRIKTSRLWLAPDHAVQNASTAETWSLRSGPVPVQAKTTTEFDLSQAEYVESLEILCKDGARVLNGKPGMSTVGFTGLTARLPDVPQADKP